MDRWDRTMGLSDHGAVVPFHAWSVSPGASQSNIDNKLFSFNLSSYLLKFLYILELSDQFTGGTEHKGNQLIINL